MVLLLVGSAVFAVGIAVFGPWVARVIYKRTPEDARVLLIVLALNFVAFAATMAQSYGLTAPEQGEHDVLRLPGWAGGAGGGFVCGWCGCSGCRERVQRC